MARPIHQQVHEGLLARPRPAGGGGAWPLTTTSGGGAVPRRSIRTISSMAARCASSLRLMVKSAPNNKKSRMSRLMDTRTVQRLRACHGSRPDGSWRLPGPWFLTGVSLGSGVKRSTCTLIDAFPPVLVVLRSQSRSTLEGRTRTLIGPSPGSGLSSIEFASKTLI